MDIGNIHKYPKFYQGCFKGILVLWFGIVTIFLVYILGYKMGYIILHNKMSIQLFHVFIGVDTVGSNPTPSTTFSII